MFSLAEVERREEEMTIRFESVDELKRNTSPDFQEKNAAKLGIASQGTLPTPRLAEDINRSSVIPVGRITKVVTSEHEVDFQKWLIKELQTNGWRVHAERVAMTKKGWVTPVQGSPGYPDITAVRPPRFLLAELKSDSGQASPDQVEWLMKASKCPSLEIKIWSPKDRDEIFEWIK